MYLFTLRSFPPARKPQVDALELPQPHLHATAYPSLMLPFCGYHPHGQHHPERYHRSIRQSRCVHPHLRGGLLAQPTDPYNDTVGVGPS